VVKGFRSKTESSLKIQQKLEREKLRAFNMLSRATFTVSLTFNVLPALNLMVIENETQLTIALAS
jgi:hypothetical protein